MKRLSIQEKREIAKALSDANRPLNQLVEGYRREGAEMPEILQRAVETMRSFRTELRHKHRKRLATHRD